MSWRETAERILKAGDIRDNRAISFDERPNGPNVPIVPQVIALNPARMLKAWHGHLSRLDALAPPHGVGMDQWEKLCDASWWLYEEFGSYAVRNGWGADGLFGVRLDLAPSGGLAQVLGRNRSLVFDGPIAHIRLFGGTVLTRNPMCGHGLPLVWGL